VKNIIDMIDELVRDIPGWSPPDQLFALYMLALSTAPLKGDIWEIGSWCGRTSVVLASSILGTGKGKLHCIDLFPDRDDWYQNKDGTYSFSVNINGKTYKSYQEKTVWKEPYERDILPVYEKYGPNLENIFINFVKTKGCAGIVRHYRGIAPEYAKGAHRGIRLAFIDGDHSYEGVCNDIAAVEKHIIPGGWIAFDDAFSCYEGVNRAIEERIINGGRYECGQLLTRKCFAARRK
jgi:hypothetical protein